MNMARPAARHNAVDMFSSDPPGIWHLWHLVTRLGEAQVVLPLTLLLTVSRARSPEAKTHALRWVVLLGVAVLVTAASKVAFIGWGIGSAALDFTGVSGHAMFAAALYPPLLSTVSSGTSPRAHRLAVAAGCGVALLVGVSRFVLGTHSASEVLAGWVVGGLVACAVLTRGRTWVPAQVRGTIVVTAALWLTLMPAAGPALDTHSIVTRVALKLSGHARPYIRTDLLRDH
jgi:membrane-associated phospholipid phosphatase